MFSCGDSGIRFELAQAQRVSKRPVRPWKPFERYAVECPREESNGQSVKASCEDAENRTRSVRREGFEPDFRNSWQNWIGKKGAGVTRSPDPPGLEPAVGLSITNECPIGKVPKFKRTKTQAVQGTKKSHGRQPFQAVGRVLP